MLFTSRRCQWRAFPLILRGFATWASCLWPKAQVEAQTPYSALQTTPLYPSKEGTFTWPSGTTGIFDEGSSMTVTWTTDYAGVNLYLVYNQTVGLGIQAQTQLATGYTDRSYDWVVDCLPNCSAPFTFHAVNAQGTSAEQKRYGFWTRPFWIKPSTSSAVSESTQSASSSSKSTSSSSTSASSSSKSALSAGSSTASSAPKTSETSSGRGGSAHGTTIGVGVGVGVSVVLLLAGGFVLWRWYHRKMKEKYSRPQSTSEQTSWQQYPSYSQQQSSSVLSELKAPGAMSPVEAPSWQLDPQELPAQSPY